MITRNVFIYTIYLLSIIAAQGSFASLQRQDSLKCLSRNWTESRKPIVLHRETSLSPENAAGLAYLSALVYEEPEFVEKIGHDLGFYKVKYFERIQNDFSLHRIWGTLWRQLSDHPRLIVADTKGAWFENDDVIVVAFTGTNPTNIKNLLTDAMAKPTDYADMGKVHSGFYGAATVAWRSINEELVELKKQKKSKPIIFTGHSLGAGVATIAAVHLLRVEDREARRQKNLNVTLDRINWDRPYISQLYTFGSPEVGDSDFRAAGSQLFFHHRDIEIINPDTNQREEAPMAYSARFINEHDVVPKVPGTPTYFHFWDPFQLSNVDGFIKSLGKWPNAVDNEVASPTFFGTVLGTVKTVMDGLRFHNINQYLAKLLPQAGYRIPMECAIPVVKHGDHTDF